jgi:hypothetical protein
MRNKFLKMLPVALAGVLQVMPMLRAVLPEAQAVAPSSWAFVLQLAAGAATLLGGVHAVSGASVSINGVGSPKSFTIRLTNGVAMTPVRLTTAGQTASSWSTTTATLNSSRYPLSPGLYLTNSTGYIGGTPTQASTNTFTISAWENSGNSGATISTNFTFAIAAVAAAGTAPSIVTPPPASLNVTAGQPVNFGVAASGTATLGYQWRKDLTNYLAGAIGTNFALVNAHAADAGNYDVVVTNAYGAVTSSVTALTVTLPAVPKITPLVAPVGGQFQFSFEPVVGLTNVILTNSLAAAGGWGVWTNIPPPASTNIITVTDPAPGGQRFYRTGFIP